MTKPILIHQTLPGFFIIAHRGASYYAPENTMSAFRKAHEMQADMIELDVLLTRDNVPIVFHDPNLNNKTNGSGFVSDLSLNELLKLDAGIWFGKQFVGSPIPILEEVLDWAHDKISLVIEIKHESVSETKAGGVEEKVSELIMKYQMEKHVMVSSFSSTAIQRMKEINPEISTGLLYDRIRITGGDVLDLVRRNKADSFHCDWRRLRKDWLNQLREHNLPVFVYTVNDEKRMRKLIKKGVNGIFTDRPDLLKRVVEEEMKRT